MEDGIQVLDSEENLPSEESESIESEGDNLNLAIDDDDNLEQEQP